MLVISDKVGFMNPWTFVIQDNLQIPDNKNQKFSRVLETRYETLHIPYAPVGKKDIEVCIRIFCDTLDNLFISACCFNGKGEIIGHAERIPVKMTSHGDVLRSGSYVNAVDRTISEANIRALKGPLLDLLEEEYMNSLFNGDWWMR